MSDPNPELPIRFGPFRFDPESGELWRLGEERPERLPPQPARLLTHLIQRAPRLVSREEIRDLLWPGVEVEFEQGLHGCVRQIRAAMGDSPTAPEYIETIPRRGYRFLGTIERKEQHSQAESTGGDKPAPKAQQRVEPAGWPLALAMGLGIALVLLLAFLRFTSPGPEPPTRIAVMPFEPRGDHQALTPGNSLAEDLVRLLAEAHPRAEIVGPTTTQAYAGGPERDLVIELAIDLVINGRQLTGDSGDRLLVEIIRGRDGAHTWVRYLDELPEGEARARTIARAVAAELRE